MARSRNIKPGFFKNEILSDLDPICRLLFAGLWTMADKAGRLEYRPKRIKAEIFPYDDFDVESCINHLCGMHDSTKDDPFLLKYEADGKYYLQVLNWDKHQKPHHKEAESEVPAPSASTTTTCDARPMHESSMNHTRPKQNASCPTDSLNLIPDSLHHLSTNHARAVHESSTVHAWVEVEGKLVDLGMARPATAIEGARSRDCSPDHVLAIARHWESKRPAWELGALHDRIRDALPGDNPSERWPPEAEKPSPRKNDPTTERENKRATIVRRMRKEGKPQAEIDSELKRKGFA